MTERDPRAGGSPPPDAVTGGDAAPPPPPATPAPAQPRPASARPEPGPGDAPTVAWNPPARSELISEAPPARGPVRRASAGRVRWGIALLVTALIVGVGIAAFVLVSGQRSNSAVVGYVPDDTLMYGELRLDLPGDQRQKLGQFLSKFPGFRDQSTLDVKLDDVLDRIIRAATQDQQDWTTKIEPWFGGQLGLSMGPLPTTADDAAMAAGRGLLVATVKDAALARTWVDEVIATSGAGDATTETYSGVEVRLWGEGDARGGLAIPDGKVLLVGDETSLRTAIDTGGNGGFGNTERFRAASASLEGDSLGHMYIDMTRYLEWSAAMSGEMGVVMPLPALTADLTPDWVLVNLQARGDALAIEVTSPHLELGPDDNRVGPLAEHLPPGTLLLSDAHEYGATMREIVARVRADPEMAEVFTQIDEYLAVVGGEDGVLGWMGDAGIAVARNGDGVHGGLVFTPTDRAKAERLFTTLRSFANLGGSSAGITIRDEDHNGTPITIIDAGDFDDLMGAAGAADVPGIDLPEGRAELAWAVSDQVVVIGVGPSFVRAVLDAGPGPSLAEDGRYRAHLAQVTGENLGGAWIDITAIRELVETLGPADPDSFAAYERDVKPYLLPLDAAIGSNARDGDVDRSTFIVTVK